MHGYLILGVDKEKVSVKTGELIEKIGAKKNDFKLQKIEEVRELAKFTSLSLPEKTVIVINDFDKVTIPAQNAFLKALEEPQPKLTYILTAISSENILETIISRCQIIEVASNEKISDEVKIKMKEFLNSGVGEKLKFSSQIKEREKAIEFCENLLRFCHLEKKWQETKQIVKTLNNLNANGNVQIQLTNLVIGL